MCWISALRACRVMAWNDRSLKVLGIPGYNLERETRAKGERFLPVFPLQSLQWTWLTDWLTDWHLTSHWYLFSGSNLYFWENYKMQDFLALWWVNFRPKSKVIMGYHVFFGFSQAHCSPSVSRYKYLPQLQREKDGATRHQLFLPCWLTGQFLFRNIFCFLPHSELLPI